MFMYVDDGVPLRADSTWVCQCRWIEIACHDVLDSSSVSACHACIKGFTRKICFFF